MSIPLSSLTDQQLAMRAFFLAIISIDAKHKGTVNEWVEENFPPLVEEVNLRFKEPA